MPEELFTTLLQDENLKIERIVSRDHVSPADEWYDQDREEWVLLVQGEAVLEFAGQPKLIKLQTGDYLHIPAHCKHRVNWTHPDKDSIWLAIHFGS
ncbi:phosphoribosylaminoimidazole carboxylase [Methylococcaceae bacterium HT4]|nr:phosphoribosylaminoimidazole carboxylase [Methylococcaceae bacterium CS5]TXK98439.1 phosphoribosylaminoimidazole carboxylase [Methylococcaceae bacterium CS4]TXL02227.1 phosphoribosylaminoimidazole carboxylase [Methylococcaceae bacterium CS1]TXL02261.1 phosphoribosylaminoimidazole carboxylase [Methylococcaceae bacterium CS3]TXL11121.1 phosphoribosylaminoimidazole carboxylase [Methylococcaceae bacterium CS2]TXL13205.1 phosphoribosylaminoimidazole carboxylase [Methylococcaceae bacterium HT5]T